jgi:hypothetical protein
LQGGHGIVSAQTPRECIGQAARQKVNFTRVAVGCSWRDHLDANRQGSSLEYGHELAQGAAFPLGDPIRRWSGHSSAPSSS